MTHTAFTFSLSRWHSISQRVRASAQAKQTEAISTLGSTTLQHAPTQAQKTALAARGARALVQIDEARQALVVEGAVRKALAEANATAGVTGLLAEIEAKRQEARLLGALLDIDLLTRVSVDEAAAAMAARANDQGLLSSRHSVVAVTLVDINALEPLREQRNMLQAEINALNDRVNDLNKQTLKLELPDALAKEIGL